MWDDPARIVRDSRLRIKPNVRTFGADQVLVEIARHGNESTGNVSFRWRGRHAAGTTVLEPGGGVWAGLVCHHDADHGEETDGQRTKEGKARVETGGQPAEALAQKSIEKELQSLQGNLWHGHVEGARKRIEELQWELVLTAGDSENRDQLWKQLREFDGYIRNHRELLPNYGERYRNGERISTALVESTLNQVVSQRMVKRQPMQWTERGAHLFLQTRTRVLNGELDEMFRRWYPKFRSQEPAVLKAAA